MTKKVLLLSFLSLKANVLLFIIYEQYFTKQLWSLIKQKKIPAVVY